MSFCTGDRIQDTARLLPLLHGVSGRPVAEDEEGAVHLQTHPREGEKILPLITRFFHRHRFNTAWKTRHSFTSHLLARDDSLVTLRGSSQTHPPSHTNATAAETGLVASLCLPRLPEPHSLLRTYVHPHAAIPRHIFQGFRHSRARSAAADTQGSAARARASVVSRVANGATNRPG